jgi:hypothetical protein
MILNVCYPKTRAILQLVFCRSKLVVFAQTEQLSTYSHWHCRRNGSMRHHGGSDPLDFRFILVLKRAHRSTTTVPVDRRIMPAGCGPCCKGMEGQRLYFEVSALAHANFAEYRPQYR